MQAWKRQLFSFDGYIDGITFFLLFSEEDVSRCLEGSKTGLCKALLKYWYYNPDRQACEEFTYGRCVAGSSQNKFLTKTLCQNACTGVKRLN